MIKLSDATAAHRNILIYLTTDGTTPATGLTFSGAEIQVQANGGAFANFAGTMTEIGNGLYVYQPTAGEIGTLGPFAVRVNKTGARVAVVAEQVVAFDPYDAAGLGLSRVDAATSTRAQPSDVPSAAAVAAAVAAPSAATIASAVGDLALSAHTTTGSLGKALGDASTAAATTATNLDAKISSRLAPTVAARTLDVSATGEAGMDLANVGSPTTTLNLSGVTIKTATDIATQIAALTIPTAAQNAIAVVDQNMLSHTSAGTVGECLANSKAAAAITTSNLDVAVSSRLAPTVAARTLDVSATGEAGIDWANIGSPTTSVGLSGTTVKTATDVATQATNIQSRLPTALDASGNMMAQVKGMDTDTVTAAAVKADAITEIQTGLATSAAVGSVQTDTTLLLARLSSTRAGLLDNLDVAISTRAAASDLVTLAAAIATIDSEIDALTTAVASVQSDTDDIQSQLATNLDAAVSTRAAASAVTSVQADTTSLLSRLTSTRATKLDFLDVAISSRAAQTTLASLAIAVGALPSADAITTAVWAFAHESGRTAKGVLARMDALMTGKATGLLGALARLYRADGTTIAWQAAQDVEAGTRDAATNLSGD